ncbi:MAG: TonB-dependent receptor plug domain-containing protein [Candidatus Symbiothrix sp.]|jgi:TonB-dependent SusC/RagA subfamily outer membrane receptor|nr:TonB-dependent receptor plug domain-containing protein [Candidatus Symbiothrix sp.]
MKTKIKFSVVILSLLLSINGLNAQNVKGKIVDKNGDPISGATISYGENQGITADNKGEFTVNLAEVGKQFSVNSLGYKSKQVNLNNRSRDLTIQLDEDLKTLDQLVITGYGKSSREKLTGSVSSITAETLAQYPGTSVLEVLQGRVAGLSIAKSSGLSGSNASINIRGLNTPSGAVGDACGCCTTGESTNTEPLIIIDGVPFINQSISPLDIGAVGATGPLATLSTSDLERIDVLKDADATAIYGSRGANGVILISTKKGAKN